MGVDGRPQLRTPSRVPGAATPRRVPSWNPASAAQARAVGLNQPTLGVRAPRDWGARPPLRNVQGNIMPVTSTRNRALPTARPMSTMDKLRAAIESLNRNASQYRGQAPRAPIPTANPTQQRAVQESILGGIVSGGEAVNDALGGWPYATPTVIPPYNPR